MRVNRGDQGEEARLWEGVPGACLGPLVAGIGNNL